MSKSASQKKQQGSAGKEASPFSFSTETAKRKSKNKTRNIILGVVVTVVAIALVISLAYVVGQQKLKPDYDVAAPVATVGSHEITVPVYNYFFYNSVSTFMNQYGSYASYFGLDTSLSLDSQYQDEENNVTWGDYFETQTDETIKEYYNIYDYALNDGFTLSEEDNDTIASAVDELKAAAKTNGLSVEKYLNSVYGSGCTLDAFKEYLTVMQTVSSYYAQCEDSLYPTEDEIAEEYAANPDDYDQIVYLLYSVNTSDFAEIPEDEDENIELTDENKADAKAKAEEALADFPEDEATSRQDSKSTASSSTTEQVADWLFSGDRVAGDTESFATDDESMFYVVKYVSRDTLEYNPVDAYVLTMALDTDDDTTNSTKFAEACAELTSDLSVDEYVAKATSYNSTFSGLTSDITKTTYNEEITDFLFDPNRKEGDVRSFTTDSSYYIVRFANFCETTYQHSLVETALFNEAYEEWHETVSTSLEFTANDSMRQYISSDLQLNSSSES